MPSDPRLEQVLALLKEPHERYRAAVSAAADQIGDYLDQHRPAETAEPANRLGRFAAGRMSEARFASLFESPPLGADRLEPVNRAAAALADLLRQEEPVVHPLARGGELGRLTGEILARTGRAFGAAMLFQAARAGAYRPAQHDRLLEGLPFARWNRSERRLAPPVAIQLDGADAWAEALAPYLDGGMKLVLLIAPPCSPAPLVRLITPGVFVAQAADPAELAGFLAFDGPGVAALVPDGAARFTHDPAGGPALAQRLRLDHLPAEGPRPPVDGRSARQQEDELRQLALLAELAAGQPAPTAGPGPAGGDSVEVIASWLLVQSGLTPGGEAMVP